MTETDLNIPARSRSTAQRPGASAPTRAKARPHASKGMKASLHRVMRRIFRNPIRSTLQLGMVTTGVFIVANALIFQTARHPSPWGGGVVSQASLDIVPLPPSRPNAMLQTSGTNAVLPVNAAVPVSTPSSIMTPTTKPQTPVREAARESARVSQPRADYALSGMQAAPVPPASVKTAGNAPRDPIGDLIRSSEPVRSAANTPRNPAKPRGE